MISKTACLLSLFVLTLIGYSVFSYSLTDPNLVITSWPPYWQFQQWMWQVFFENRILLTGSYIGLITLMWSSFAGFSLIENVWSNKKLILLYVVCIIPLMLSYNALSHDVFNYMFNAKMVLVYQDNPHQNVALNFPNDEWVRFMHNTHTPAPYGYGWTILSLAPYILGLGKFVTSWLSFRILAILSIYLLWLSLRFAAAKMRYNLTFSRAVPLFFLPLLLIEVVSNMHNDLWMLIPAIVSLALLLDQRKKTLEPQVILSGFLLLTSISIKLATVVLIPIWILLLINRTEIFHKFSAKAESWHHTAVKFWPLLSSLLLFLPLLTARSKQFLPWYLLWVLVWFPLMRAIPDHPILNHWQQNWKKLIMVLSIAVTFRYVPWLWQGDYSGNVELYQKLITWIPFVFAIGYLSLRSLLTNKK